MFKRLMIGLVAVGVVAIFIAETANATVSRRRRTVENLHGCVLDPCSGATSVTDRIFGAEEVPLEGGVCAYFQALDGKCYRPTCEITGTLVCENTDYVCGVVETTTVGLTQLSFQSEAFFNDVDYTAIGITVLDRTVGEGACHDEGAGNYLDYLPDAIVALSVYALSGGSSYELLEVCPTFAGDTFVCEPWWNSTSADPRPKLPCCGDPTTLTVSVTGGGRVTSNDDNINCVEDGKNCGFEYGTEPPYDTCPEVTLTAIDHPSGAYGPVVWTGCDDVSLDNECIVTPTAQVTATFPILDNFISVTVTADSVGGARAWIQDPSRTNFTYPDSKYCTPANGPCYINTSVLPFSELDSLVLKRKGGDYLQWVGGPCGDQTNNSVATCQILLPLLENYGGGLEVEAQFP